MTDEEKLDKKGYMILIKKSNKPLSQELINKIIKRDLGKKGKKLGIEITNSYYTHGSYDWVISFNATSIQEAKRLVEEINKLHEEYISDLQLIEKMFSVVSCGVTNPDIKKLNDYFKI